MDCRIKSGNDDVGTSLLRCIFAEFVYGE
jgi:hypothetical protein